MKQKSVDKCTELCKLTALICDDDSFNVMALQCVLENLGESVAAFDSG